ncbi:MAG: glucose-1-phosphate thymidylyltransferase RfbA [Oscillospiraceae bacterium]|jgi:glucose-1-phosphate thymidylyltransferase|nr:glucose-1-phosphate thymidylyltransferase RfbA [Oscillospiraceae bacterium]
MKGIVLAGGKGTRLYPITKPCYKPLLPVYDKPMIYYPIATLMMAGIREILIITPPDGTAPFRQLLGDGSALGVRFSYKEQTVQRGIADAFLVGEEFIGDDSICLVLGDNIFDGPGFEIDLGKAVETANGATVFGYYVEDPRPFGVVEIDAHGKAVSIEEKPSDPKSHYIIPGLYFYDNRVVQIAKTVQPSARGELEITSVNNAYLKLGELSVIKLGTRFCWYDTGTAESMFQASEAVRDIQHKQHRLVGCLEAIAYRKGFIDRVQLLETAESLKMTEYGRALLRLAE